MVDAILVIPTRTYTYVHTRAYARVHAYAYAYARLMELEWKTTEMKTVLANVS